MNRDHAFHYDLEAFRRQLERRGIHDPAVLDAMTDVPREAFVSTDLAPYAYNDSPLPIEEGQTISQPFIVALMTQATQAGPDDKVLEVGTGSGYGAAVLSRVAAKVYTIERHRKLVEDARERMAELGYDNVEVSCGDGSRGWPEHAPYDAIVVTAGGPRPPRSLLDQLAEGGRLVIPIGESAGVQQLLRITRDSDGEFTTEELGAVRFVPLIGEEAWADEERPKDSDAKG